MHVAPGSRFLPQTLQAFKDLWLENRTRTYQRGVDSMTLPPIGRPPPRAIINEHPLTCGMLSTFEVGDQNLCSPVPVLLVARSFPRPPGGVHFSGVGAPGDHKSCLIWSSIALASAMVKLGAFLESVQNANL